LKRGEGQRKNTGGRNQKKGDKKTDTLRERPLRGLDRE